MKLFSILLLILSFGLNLFAQEYFYWYREGKIPLELIPRKKFIIINDPSDTIQLKIRLLQKNYIVHPFVKYPITGNKFVQKDCDWGTIVECFDSLPIISNDTAILCESPCFYYRAIEKEVIVTHRLYVKLKQSEDFSILVNKVKDNNLTIYSNNQTMPLLYILACTKKSTGNALQLANSLYEMNMFSFSEPEFLTLTNLLIPLGLSINSKFEHNKNELFKINASNLVICSKDDPIVFIGISSLDGKSIFCQHAPSSTEQIVNLHNIKGLYILTVKLISGDIRRDKVLLNF